MAGGWLVDARIFNLFLAVSTVYRWFSISAHVLALLIQQLHNNHAS